MDATLGPVVGHHRVAMITRRRVVITALLTFAVGLLIWVAQSRATPSPRAPAGSTAPSSRSCRATATPPSARARSASTSRPGGRPSCAIDGREIPEDQLRRNDPLNQVFFMPGEGQDIEELDPGPHLASALIWRIGSQTREDGRTVNWRFRVS